MEQLMSGERLQQENCAYEGTGGRSQENHEFGFIPAFLDSETGNIYRSRFANGRPAPFHLLDGLPEEVVLTRNSVGRIAHVKASVVSGFVRCGLFHTREQAARALDEAERALAA